MKVYECINKVQNDLAKLGVRKTQTNQHDRYQFRGIDDIYNALAPLLGKHGLCVLPEVMEREVAERQSRNGGAMLYVTVKVKFAFVAAEDGSSHEVITYGEAMDRSDKATNKAMLAAYKYACFQAFCIPTESQDADSETPEIASKEQERMMAFHRAKEDHAGSINTIKEALNNDDLSTAAEAWFELDDESKRALWVAPTKGGPFSTKEREVIKSKEFRVAYYGDDQQVA